MPEDPNPSGLCMCGCGAPTTIIGGRHKRFLRGHAVRIAYPVEKRILFVEEDRGFSSLCWVWQGSFYSNGYGRLGYRGKVWLAHRLMYERSGAVLPDGLELHHMCEQRACVNPDHLEPVTVAEHRRRHPREPRPYRPRVTHCLRGHLYTDENTYWGQGRRTCRACRLIRQKRRAR